MTVYEIIQEFIKKNNYIQNEHVLGILFYGSYQYGLNNPNQTLTCILYWMIQFPIT